MKACPVTLTFKPAETDKDKMLEDFRARHRAYEQRHPHPGSSSTSPGVENGVSEEEHKHELGEDSLPVLKHTGEEATKEEGWVTFDKPIIYL